jgi:integration host factor subunit alpha
LIFKRELWRDWGWAMTGKTVTRADLCEAVYQKVGLSRTESSALVELVLKEITDCLERGETVKLSSFGSFVVRKKGQRVGRNPKTGTEVPISPRRVMVFKPSAILKQRINNDSGNSGGADAKQRRRDRGNGGRGPRPRKRGGSWKRRPKRFAPSARLRTNSTCRSTCCDSGRPGFPRSAR